MSTVRAVVVLTVLHARHVSRSSFEVAVALVVPVLQATLAFYLVRAADHPRSLLQAAVGAGLMGVWSSVLFGSGGAVKQQRLQGTLELLVLSPRNGAVALLPVTVAFGLVGTYALVGTLAWGHLLYGVPLDLASPWMFLLAAPTCVLALGMSGLLLAALLVPMRNANALCNALEYPVWLLSGMLVPLTVLPSWLNRVADLLPTTWGARAVHEAVGGGPVWPALAVCVVASAACVGVGAVLMSVLEHRARVTATLALT